MPESDEHRRTVVAEQHIRETDAPVGHPARVQRAHGIDDRSQDRHRLPRPDLLIFGDESAETTPADPFDDERHPPVGERRQVVEMQRVRVHHPAERLDLAIHPIGRH